MARLALLCLAAAWMRCVTASEEDATKNESAESTTQPPPLSADDVNPVVTLNAGTLSLEQLVCNDRCAGLASFWEDVNVAWRELPVEATGVQRCNAVRVWAETVRCGQSLWDEASCVKVRGDIVDLATNCSSWGIDIAEDLLTSNGQYVVGVYNESSCSLCSQFYGAVPHKILTSTPKGQCQTKCDEDASCATYDFDLTRSLCRHWASCPPCARAANNCPWNVYEKPDAHHVATSVPSGGKGCGSTKTIYVDATSQETASAASASENGANDTQGQVMATAIAGAPRRSELGMLGGSFPGVLALAAMMLLCSAQS